MRAAARRWSATGAGRAALAVAGALGLAVSVTAALGGFRAVPPEELLVVVAGEPVDLGPVAVTVLDHLVSDEVETSRLETIDGAGAWLVVRARVEVLDDATHDVLPDVLLPPPGTTLTDRPEMQVLLRDGTSLPQGHPGLAEEIAYLWPVAEPGAVPARLELELLGSTPYFSPAYGREMWGSPEPVARVGVPSTVEVPEVLVEEVL